VRSINLLDPNLTLTSIPIVPADLAPDWECCVTSATWDSLSSTVSSAELVRGSSTFLGQTSHYGLSSAAFAQESYQYSETPGVNSGDRTLSVTASSSSHYRADAFVSSSAATLTALASAITVQQNTGVPGAGHAVVSSLTLPADFSSVPTGLKEYQREFVSGSSTENLSMTQSLSGETINSTELHSSGSYSDLYRSRYFLDDAYRIGNRNSATNPREFSVGLKIDSEIESQSHGGWSADFAGSPQTYSGSLISTAGSQFRVLKDNTTVTVGNYIGGVGTLSSASRSTFNGSVGGATGSSLQLDRTLTYSNGQRTVDELEVVSAANQAIAYSNDATIAWSAPMKDATLATVGTGSGTGIASSSGQAQADFDGRVVYDILGGTTSVDLSSTSSGSGNEWGISISNFDGASGTNWSGTLIRNRNIGRSNGSYSTASEFSGEYDSEGRAVTRDYSETATFDGSSSGQSWSRVRDASGLEGTSLVSLNGASYHAETDVDASWCGDLLDSATLSGSTSSNVSVATTDTLVGPLDIYAGSGSIDLLATSTTTALATSDWEVGYEDETTVASLDQSSDSSGVWSQRGGLQTSLSDGSANWTSLGNASGNWYQNEDYSLLHEGGLTTEEYTASLADHGNYADSVNGSGSQTDSHGKTRSWNHQSLANGSWDDTASAAYERITPESSSSEPSESPPEWVRTAGQFSSARQHYGTYGYSTQDNGYGREPVVGGTETYQSNSSGSGWSQTSWNVAGTPEDYTYTLRSASLDISDASLAIQSTYAPSNGPSTGDLVSVSASSALSSNWNSSSHSESRSRQNRDGRVLEGVATESLIDDGWTINSHGQSNGSGTGTGPNGSTSWSSNSNWTSGSWSLLSGNSAAGAVNSGWYQTSNGSSSYTAPDGSVQNATLPPISYQLQYVGHWGGGQNGTQQNGGTQAPQQGGGQTPPSGSGGTPTGPAPQVPQGFVGPPAPPSIPSNSGNLSGNQPQTLDELKQMLRETKRGRSLALDGYQSCVLCHGHPFLGWVDLAATPSNWIYAPSDQRLQTLTAPWGKWDERFATRATGYLMFSTAPVTIYFSGTAMISGGGFGTVFGFGGTWIGLDQATSGGVGYFGGTYRQTLTSRVLSASGFDRDSVEGVELLLTFGSASRPKANFPKTVNIRGTGQYPTVKWNPNSHGARTIEEAVAIAKKNGINIPDDILFISDEGTLASDTFAKYFGAIKKPGEIIRWKEFYNIHGKIPVRIREDVLLSDEAILAVFAHEMHELNALREIFSLNRGVITADELYRMISPGLSKNLHDQAWTIADELIIRLRGGK
jgi:hypothetical protein